MSLYLDKWIELHKFDVNYYQTKKLAQFIGVSPRTIQRWMKGLYAPDTDQKALIKSYLELYGK